MRRAVIVIGFLVALAAALPVTAAAPPLVLVTKNGASQSLTYIGFTFGTLSPPLGKPGTVQVDCKTPDEAAVKKSLPVGTELTSARLVISAELPHPQHFTYVFAHAKVKAISFVTGNFGPVASITLSYTKLSR
jgi:hypothetical protein